MEKFTWFVGGKGKKTEQMGKKLKYCSSCSRKNNEGERRWFGPCPSPLLLTKDRGQIGADELTQYIADDGTSLYNNDYFLYIGPSTINAPAPTYKAFTVIAENPNVLIGNFRSFFSLSDYDVYLLRPVTSHDVEVIEKAYIAAKGPIPSDADREALVKNMRVVGISSIAVAKELNK